MTIPNFDDKINVVIGELLSKADSVSKSVISTFDPSKEIAQNRNVLSSARFTRSDLEACATFLLIDLLDTEGKPLFSNKVSLANRIILQVMSFYPAICAECDSEYSVKFGGDSPPLHCFLCFQGCHDCNELVPKLNDVSLPLLGTIWLCKSCHDNNNPANAFKPQQKGSSKLSSQNASGTVTPVIAKSNKPRVSFNNIELRNKLQELQNQQQKSQQENSPNADILNPNKRLDKICDLFKVGKCPHGLSGKTEANGKPSCAKLHPKRCKRFIRHGKNKRYGCKRGNNCTLFHPKHCSSSLANKTCFNEECTLVHQVGTKRRKPPDDEQSYRRDFYNKSDNQGRGKDPPARNLPSSGTRSRTSALSGQTSNSTNQLRSDFLEVKSLLTSYQDMMQKEMAELRSKITQQESRISTFLPSVCQHLSQFVPAPHRPLNQSFMPPQFHLQSYMHPPPQMNWSNTPVSGS